MKIDFGMTWLYINLSGVDSVWKNFCAKEATKLYFKKLLKFISGEYSVHIVYPPKKLVFNALRQTPFDDVKLVILGQDPYHGEGQAHGLSFSVPKGERIPPSLRNIFKEIGSTSSSGDLTYLASQGVLLLNSVLTVRAGAAGSHRAQGWETFTDAIIQKISDEKENVVFMLWGAYAQEKSTLIDSSKHLILESPHPSPFSAYKGFFGNKHFKKANAYFKKKEIQIIEWIEF